METLSLPEMQSCRQKRGFIKECERNISFLSVQQMRMHRRVRVGYKGPQNAAIGACRPAYAKVFAMSQSSVEQIRPRFDIRYDSKEHRKGYSYLFRTEVGGLVKVLVAKTDMKYDVNIQVLSLPQYLSTHDLILNWCMFRSDSSSFYVPHLQMSDSGSESSSEIWLDSMRTTFIQNSLGSHTVTLKFDLSQAPFYLSFLLYSDDVASIGSGIRTHRKTAFCVPLGMGAGYALPLGVSTSNGGLTNFSLFSRNADNVVLCLYDGRKNQPSLEIELDPYINRTGDIWHVLMETIENYVYYGYRCKRDTPWDKGGRFQMRHVLLDPYAKMISTLLPDQSELRHTAKCLGSLEKEPTFDWSDDASPRLPMEKMVVYRLNVQQFTKDRSSGLPENVAGTFAGVIEKLQHFITLGVNAVLLEPIFPFDEQKGPYFPYHFFLPMTSYGLTGDCVSAINSMKEMVKKLHSNGIEVLMEVVFTHTSESYDAACQTISFGGIDNVSYYIVNGGTESGYYKTINCNNPTVQQMIIDSLHYWLTEFHIDGFCFINSASLVRDSKGDYLSRPPLVEAIAFDPLLSKAKIIADCWSPLDMSYTDIRFPHWKRWADMNTSFCSDVRNFLRGEGLLSNLATRLCGSGDLFSDARGPAFSFNYVAKNFGLSLVDLVSFSSNELASELSWNCGKEGPTNSNYVLEIRLKQIRNFIFILFVSLGIPVLNMGDECGHSVGGSSVYIDRQPIDWDGLGTSFGMQITQFITFLSSLRARRSDLFQRKEFLEVENIEWYGSSQSQPKWDDPSCKFLAMLLKAEEDVLSVSDKGDLFFSFNASNLTEPAILPQLSEGYVWHRLVDTSLPYPGFFSSESNAYKTIDVSVYEVKPHCCALFEAQRSNSKRLLNELL